MFDQEELHDASLAGLGVILMDTVDGIVADSGEDEIDELDAAHQGIGQEVIRRVPDPEKLEVLLDFHYDKWKKVTKVPAVTFEDQMDANNAFYEFKAMMTGYTELYRTIVRPELPPISAAHDIFLKDDSHF